jgi:small subunit ribosomal protein S4e
MGHHQKRLAAPRSWSIPRKAFKWIAKPSPGPGAKERSLPLGVILRDYLKQTETMREARRVIGAGEVLVDNRVVKDHKFPVSFFDVVTVPKLKQSYRVLMDYRGRITVDPIPEKEAGWKLCRVQDKTTIKGGLTQLNLHDGRNITVVKDTYKTGDVVRIELPSQEIKATYPLKEGALCLVTGGRHAGEVATLDSVEVKRISGENMVTLKAGDRTLRTVKGYAFPIGAKKSEITLPEGVVR